MTPFRRDGVCTLAAAVIAGGLLVACTTVKEVSYSGDAVAGKKVVEEMCASCHAVGSTGGSPDPRAPPLRHVLARYAPDRLAEDLDQAVSISHLKMPTFFFDEHHPQDIVAYLRTIQQPAPPSPQ